VHFGPVDHRDKQIRPDVHTAAAGLLRIPPKRSALGSNERINSTVRRIVFRPIYQIEK
jgi:hypothetical protein